MGTAAGVGAAANIVGGEMQGWASVLDQMRMGQAYKSEMERQRGFQQQAMNVFGAQPGKSTPGSMMAGVRAGAGQRMGEYEKLAGIPLGPGPSGQIGQPGYNPAAADAYNRMVGGYRAKNLGYGDFQVQQAIDNMRAQQQLAQIANFAGGQAQRVFPLQMYKAQHMYDWLSQLGQAISSIGGTAANYAQYAQAPKSGPSYPPPGTGYNPFTDQSTAPGIYPMPSYYQ